MLNKIFISPSEPRLRAGWRLVLFVILSNGLALVLSLPAGILYVLFFGSKNLPDVFFLVLTIVSAISTTVAVWVCRRFIDRRSFSSLGLTLNMQAIYDVAAGIGIAIVIMGVIFAFEWMMGWLTINGFAWDYDTRTQIIIGILIWLSTFLLTGWNEELSFRGYTLQNLIDGLNVPLGVIISSVWFGLAHLGNPFASWTAVVGILVAGVFFAWCYLITKQLWLPVGLHIGWNLAEGVIFGFPVSGLQTYQLVRQRVAGPDLITGGKFGPEAGLVLLPALALGALLVYGYNHLHPHTPTK
jgi:CAAX protease family protein